MMPEKKSFWLLIFTCLSPAKLIRIAPLRAQYPRPLLFSATAAFGLRAQAADHPQLDGQNAQAVQRGASFDLTFNTVARLPRGRPWQPAPCWNVRFVQAPHGDAGCWCAARGGWWVGSR